MSGRRDSSTNWDSPAPNSLECWDYSIELECLQGPEGKMNLALHDSMLACYIFIVKAAN